MNTTIAIPKTAANGAISRSVNRAATALDLLQPLLALGCRWWVALQFWKSGLLKISSWDTTLFLFREEYRTPVLPPELAAVAGTAGELAFPLLLFVGLFTRLGAIGLFGVNVMAFVAYRHVLLSAGFEAAAGQHLLWGLMLAVVIAYGPGRLSLDYLIFGRGGSTDRI